ncbi:hypothetical protein ILYODFUR_016713 [Ilyodon furcidens]|uniref:Uncharacterized protein n=1 Tax=Ilyodon furcidens TaxID=33524 RepID=A0ABV0TKC4_9TELE
MCSLILSDSMRSQSESDLSGQTKRTHSVEERSDAGEVLQTAENDVLILCLQQQGLGGSVGEWVCGSVLRLCSDGMHGELHLLRRGLSANAPLPA